MTRWILLFSLLCTSCSKDTVERLEHTRWGNSAQSCSENYVTFDGGQIVAHPWGGVLPMWKINGIDDHWFSSTVDVRIEPVEYVVKAIERAGHHMPDDPEITLHLTIEGDQLRINSASHAGVTKELPPRSPLTMFNGFACPS